VAGTKRPAAASIPAPPPQKPRKAPEKTILVPKTLRDVNVFTKQKQVGQGTYGYVLLASDQYNTIVMAFTNALHASSFLLCVFFVRIAIFVVAFLS
jgi:hypothetical protein